MADKKTPWQVVETIPETDEITSLVIKAPAGVEAHGQPGQFASIRVMTAEGWTEPHPFTISCEPNGERLRFTIKKDGKFTSGIRDLQPGTQIQCSGPMGVFCKDIAAKEDIVMIAGGVGITPFLSVLRTFRTHKAQNKVTLLWSNRTLADVFAEPELVAMCKELNLRVVIVCSREASIPDSRPAEGIFYEKGRITKDTLAKYMPSPTASFYVCGPRTMQDAMLDALEECGVDKAAVQKEAFSFKKS